MSINKKICLLLSLLVSFCIPTFSQTKEEVLSKYKQAVNNLESVSYEISLIDSSHSRALLASGKVTLLKDQQKTANDFKYSVLLDESKRELLYNGKEEILLYHKEKQFSRNFKPGYYKFHSLEGWLVVHEFLKIMEGYDSLNLASNDNHFILKFHYPYDSIRKVKNTTKHIYLNKNTFLPEIIITSNKNKYNRTYLKKTLANVEINKPQFKLPFQITYHLTAYKDLNGYLQPLFQTKAPDFKLKDMDGNTVSLSSLEGKVVVLDFWATWCKPCIMALPMMEKLNKKYKEKDVVFLGILTDKANDDLAKKLISQAGINYPTLLGNSSVSDKYKIRSIPQCVIISKKGIITYADVGFSSEIETYIKGELEEL